NDPAQADFSPYVLPDGSALYFVGLRRDRPKSVYRSARSPAGELGEPAVVVSGEEDKPVVTQDELTLYHAGPFGPVTQVYVRSRASASDTFSAATVLDVLGGQDDGQTWPTWISPDGCALYLTTNRNGNYDVYVA